MTVKELCERLEVSRSTLYRRVNAAGIELDTVRGADGELSQQGAALIASLFDGVSDGTQCDTIRNVDETQTVHTKELEAEVASLRQQIGELTVKLEAQAVQLEDLRQQRDSWQQQAAAALAVAGRLIPAQTQKEPPEGQATRRRRWWELVFRR